MLPLPRPQLAAAIWLGLASTAIAAQSQPSVAATAAPADAAPARAMQIPVNGPPIRLDVGSGTLIRLPRAANTVFVASPDIADVQVKSPTLIYLTAKSPGETVIYAVDADDRVLLNAPVRVDLDLSQLRQSLRQLVPGAPISVSEVNSSLVLSGAVASAGQAEKARTLAAAVGGAVKGEQVINRLTVATPNQVDLHVRIAEVDRNILKQIGINWDKPSGNITFTTNNPVSGVNFLTGKFLPGAEQISTMIDALATEGFVTDLADPNLTAVSGQTASFLAGGEIPYEVAQPGSVGSATLYTVQFEEYGVQLAFTPTVIDADHLSLKVRPEVSSLDYAHAIPVNGVLEPGFIVRQAETTVELASGQSFALAGLLQHDTEQDISKVPWLGDIPILGALFRSNKFQNDETELVVIVTPYLVRPPITALATPLNGWAAPHDAQQVLWGDTWRRQLPAPARGPLDSGGGLIGPAGFRLD
jgi:pilus assembly protein CpaC